MLLVESDMCFTCCCIITILKGILFSYLQVVLLKLGLLLVMDDINNVKTVHHRNVQLICS